MSTPAWVEPAKVSAPVSGTSAAAPAAPADANAAGSNDGTAAKTCVAIFFLVVNLGLCVLMAYTGKLI